MQKHIYLAGGFFNPKQIALLDRVEAALKNNETVGYIHSPRDHQYKNASIDHDPDGIFGSYEWANETYNNDVTAMNLADLAVISWDNQNPDTGTAWEMGYMLASQKPVIMFCEDDVQTEGLNLMLVKGIKAYLTTTSELETYDFNLLPTKLYQGDII
ncbi:nucleoside 2-deoxyribosyltransferase [Bombilactobacillus thymidiniphilus]|uniref:Nucleoside 2-deoxyribosyltransferase n=1 Tax=Bombilactobacillus thymidiniphilus TaxID=2923363 RepID=A0ABY4PCA0_9LACO|nr:nucleoside 2-deoxyribosyltransferase [Bombilactobacillus thymidiniphilus]UQS83184.1 nucleoside 2-deoxyribosyltransferase [Bombilactobacillus thymidiniphilus]